MNDYIVPPCTAQHRLVHCTEHFLVVDKPSGLLSVPGRLVENSDSLISRVQQDFSDAFIVHRLDLDTSGLMVLARGKDALRKLNWQFERRQTAKQYTAVVYGNVAADRGSVDLPLICDWPKRPRQKVCFEHGKAALTHFEVISRHRETYQSRLLLTPITGRSHQLRVHMLALGHPISGCDFYAHDEALKQSSRLLLHASRLSFADPETGAALSFESPAPF